VFTYFHFAASEELTRAAMKSKCIAIAYETVRKPNGSLPLLTPMSEVAGRMAIQEGAKYLEKTYGINMIEGRLTCPAVAAAFGMSCESAPGLC
jgi:alanine dehydrogenase